MLPPSPSLDARPQPHLVSRSQPPLVEPIQPDVDLDLDDDDDGPAPLTFDSLPVATDQLMELKLAQDLVKAIQAAKISDDIKDPDVHHALKNPCKEPIDIDSSLLLSLQLFNAMYDCSGRAYERVRAVLNSTGQGPEIISHHLVKKAVLELTGVTYIKTDMCPNSCYAFTGPWADLDECPKCKTSRWDPLKSQGDVKVPARQFTSIPIGPVLQALYRSPTTAKHMWHGYRETVKTLEELDRTDKAHPEVLKDIYQSEAYLSAFKENKIGEHDPVLMFTLDGAQLYQNKEADCWFFFWVILSLPPELRYKKQFMIPAGFAPGPNKPDNVASFALPSWRHVGALSTKGLKVWDGDLNRETISRPFVYNSGMDTVAGPVVTGGVGHTGREGCWNSCEMPGRRKEGGSVYYPVALRPHGHDVPNSSHDDIDLSKLEFPNHQRYMVKLSKLLTSQNITDYERNRLETGLVRPSPFLGFSPNHCLPPPEGFSLDLMHLVINIVALLIPLWRGEVRGDGLTIGDCEHAFLTGDVWKEHG
ncbi:hypothetical protein BDN72DRAFT_781368 [Pluteus cervinus]|uniref:Uncharacterized protein n=1 Tax=Pluteus cervinus TaxID=181527 RepID=A0ACD3A015_9AGAR|nr:hypothetical protein BDN72DRAFT_781368 [Pluteus cervinus]